MKAPWSVVTKRFVLLFLLISIGACIGVSVRLASQQRQDWADTVQRNCRIRKDMVEKRLVYYASKLFALPSLYAAALTSSHEGVDFRFGLYADALDLNENDVLVRTTWARRVRHAERAMFEEQLGHEIFEFAGYKDDQLIDSGPMLPRVRAPLRDEYLVMQNSYPVTADVLGWNLGASASPALGCKLAVEEGAVVSRPFGDGAKPWLVVWYTAFYPLNGVPATAAARFAEFEAVMPALVDMQTLLDEAVHDLPSLVLIQMVQDEHETVVAQYPSDAKDDLRFDAVVHNASASIREAMIQEGTRLPLTLRKLNKFFDLRLSLVCLPTASLQANHSSSYSMVVGISGVVFFGLLSLFMNTNLRHYMEIRRSYVRVRTACQAADRAKRIKDSFIAFLSHEFRNPAHAILATTRFVKETARDDGLQQDMQTIAESASYMKRLADDVLDLSKMEAGCVRFECASFSVVSVLDVARSTFLPASAQKGLELMVDKSPGVPDTLMGDPYRLQQVLMNVISNAIKFTTHGSVRILVRTEEELAQDVSRSPSTDSSRWGDVSSHEDELFVCASVEQEPDVNSGAVGGADSGLGRVHHRVAHVVSRGEVKRKSDPRADHVDVVFVVLDSGIGIPRASLANLFEPCMLLRKAISGRRTGRAREFAFDQHATLELQFAQAKIEIARLYGGSGLGLSIVRQTVVRMGGSIEMRSKLNTGTRVAVRMSFAIATTPPKQPPPLPLASPLNTSTIRDRSAAVATRGARASAAPSVFTFDTNSASDLHSSASVNVSVSSAPSVSVSVSATTCTSDTRDSSSASASGDGAPAPCTTAPLIPSTLQPSDVKSAGSSASSVSNSNSETNSSSAAAVHSSASASGTSSPAGASSATEKHTAVALALAATADTGARLFSPVSAPVLDANKEQRGSHERKTSVDRVEIHAHGSGSLSSLVDAPLGSLHAGASSMTLMSVPAPTATRPQPDPKQREARRLPRVVLAEDSKINQRIVQRMIGELCDLKIANDGVEAVELTTSHRPDLILMDCVMPRMTGPEATVRIRQAGWTCPIIGITACVLDYEMRFFLGAGMNAVLTKPFSREELRGIMEKYGDPSVVHPPLSSPAPPTTSTVYAQGT